MSAAPEMTMWVRLEQLRRADMILGYCCRSGDPTDVIVLPHLTIDRIAFQVRRVPMDFSEMVRNLSR